MVFLPHALKPVVLEILCPRGESFRVRVSVKERQAHLWMASTAAVDCDSKVANFSKVWPFFLSCIAASVYLWVCECGYTYTHTHTHTHTYTHTHLYTVSEPSAPCMCVMCVSVSMSVSVCLCLCVSLTRSLFSFLLFCDIINPRAKFCSFFSLTYVLQAAGKDSCPGLLWLVPWRLFNGSYMTQSRWPFEFLDLRHQRCPSH